MAQKIIIKGELYEDVSLCDNKVVNDPRVQWCIGNLESGDAHKPLEYDIIDGKLIIKGNVIIPNEYGELPIKIDEVYGSVVVDNTIKKSYGQLVSLKNMPTIVHGKFDCSFNEGLTTLEGGPEVVEGSYWANHCNISSLEGCPKHVGGYFMLYHNKINDMKQLLECKCDHTFDVDFNPCATIDNSDYVHLLNIHKLPKRQF